MIRLIVKMGRWLDSRFPAKVVVTEAQFAALNEELSTLRAQVNDQGLSLNKTLERMSVVEGNAVHKEPVALAIQELDKLKQDYTSFKASMGFSNKALSPKIQAMLNGEVL